MYVDPHKMSDSARVWVYSSNRFFSKNEVQEIKEHLKSFVDQWTAHSSNLKATADIRFKRHIIIAVDENWEKASGCSIDSSVKFIQRLGEKYGFDGLDRLHYTYMNEGEAQIMAHQDLNEAYENGEINDETLFVNPLVKTWAEYNNAFLTSLKSSFLHKFIDELEVQK